MRRVAQAILLLLCAVAVLSGPRLHAQAAAQPPSSSSGAAQAQAPVTTSPADADDRPAPGASGAPATDADDPWGFGDEEEDDVPTWAESIRAQWKDMALFAAYATLVIVGFVKRSERLKLVTLVASVAYLGVMKGQLMSVVDIFRFVNLNFPVVQYSLAWYMFAAFFVVIMLLWGRLYCGRVCAFGMMTQLMDKIVPAKLRVTLPKAIERRASYIKFGMLAFVLIYYIITRDHLIHRFVEPFWMFTGQGTPVMWTGLAVLLVATVFVRNLYCRFLCPLGAFIGLVSHLSVFRIKRWSECSTCKICEKTCEWGAIRGPKIIVTECVRCDDCERLYDNKKKCPHWLIIQRKEDILARQRATAG